jgi:hypothetical protein
LNLDIRPQSFWQQSQMSGNLAADLAAEKANLAKWLILIRRIWWKGRDSTLDPGIMRTVPTKKGA